MTLWGDEEPLRAEPTQTAGGPADELGSDTPTDVGSPDPTSVQNNTDVIPNVMTCPRCGDEVPDQEFYGPCRACCLELRIDAAFHDFTPQVLHLPSRQDDLEDLGEPLDELEQLESSAADNQLLTPVETVESLEHLTAAATERAIAQVDENADDQWKAVALDAVRVCAREHPTFTADEVWVRLADRPDVGTHEPAALGPVFLRAAKAGWIVNTGERRKRSILVQRHRELTIWRSLLYGS